MDLVYGGPEGRVPETSSRSSSLLERLQARLSMLEDAIGKVKQSIKYLEAHPEMEQFMSNLRDVL